MSIVIERAKADREGFDATFPLLLELHAQVGMAPLNADKLARECYCVLGQGMVFVARLESGQVIGSLGLIESTYYYSDWAYLYDKWFYVQPSYRGRAGALLLLAARREADAKGTLVYIWDHNPDSKRNRGGHMEGFAARLGYLPAGYLLRLGKHRSAA